MVTLPAGGGVCVTTTPAAYTYCLERLGQWEPVVTWEEFKAWGAAAEAAGPNRAAVVAEGLAYFQSRMPPPF